MSMSKTAAEPGTTAFAFGESLMELSSTICHVVFTAGCQTAAAVLRESGAVSATADEARVAR
jgi:hypothetical protein